RNISHEEIKRAMWDCGGDRSSGPDGFSFEFFTTFWDILEPDVTHFVLEFFHSGTFPKGCNSSFIALIPKVSNGKFVTDFRPISLIGCQSKIIGKILANRLSTMIGSCISAEQSTFIKGRNILDGPLVFNEIINWYRKCKKELMIFKVGFEKAFDSLRWDVLDMIMDKLGFRLKWCSWIYGCLQNGRSSVLVNGSPSIEFEIFRGLRQGDPLSPFLFILAMEGLHAVTCKAVEIGIFKGVSFGNGVCVSEEDVSDMANAIGCGAAKLPLKYLGVPIGCNMASAQNWQLQQSKRGESGEKKTTWVKWKKCLASKKFGGLGIGSIFALNIGGIFVVSVPGSSKSTWGVILSSIKRLKQKGIDLLSLCIRKLGNGVSTRFWEDIWCGDQPLKAQFPRIYLLDTDRGCNIENRLSLPAWSTALRRQPSGGVESCQFLVLQTVITDVVLSDEQDSWQWSLDVSVGFSVSSVRSLIDAHILDVSATATRWWELDIPFCANILEWFDWLDSLHFSNKARLFLDGAGGTLLWSIWSFRNRLVFSNPSPKKVELWDSIVSQSFFVDFI
ncbi:RNA-directed DNA polymerase, eukaryota, reverse transcriptase zinc-binding domain protein, partial [Tanacetum coccineum]